MRAWLVVLIASLFVPQAAATDAQVLEALDVSMPGPGGTGTAADATWPAVAPASRPSPAAAAAGLVLVVALAPLYSRISREDVLGHPMRRRILELALDRPSLGIQSVATELGVHYRTVRHHVEALERFDLVRVTRHGPRIRVVLAGRRHDGPDPAPARILQVVTARPGVHLAAIARRVERAKSTVRWHLSRLEREGFVRVERDGGLTLVFPGPKAGIPQAQPHA